MENRPLAVEKERDRQLIEAFCNGNERAGECLYVLYHAKILKICLLTLQDPIQAEDAAQEVFIKVLAQKKIKYFRGDSMLSTWLYVVARNVCWQMMRKYKFYQHQELPAQLSDGMLDLQPNPEEAAAQEENLVQLHRLLDCVPKKYQAALLLVCIEGRGYDEAAEALHIQVKTLRVHVFRGKEMLCEICKKRFGVAKELLPAAA
jgi:RNA polymerase sigma-70 factor, ECF subfamily